eukprot:Skav221424  [mRNA]  locus=scaffold2260:17221:23097:- [translate_table: standard]
MPITARSWSNQLTRYACGRRSASLSVQKMLGSESFAEVIDHCSCDPAGQSASPSSNPKPWQSHFEAPRETSCGVSEAGLGQIDLPIQSSWVYGCIKDHSLWQLIGPCLDWGKVGAEGKVNARCIVRAQRSGLVLSSSCIVSGIGGTVLGSKVADSAARRTEKPKKPKELSKENVPATGLVAAAVNLKAEGRESAFDHCFAHGGDLFLFLPSPVLNFEGREVQELEELRVKEPLKGRPVTWEVFSVLHRKDQDKK